MRLESLLALCVQAKFNLIHVNILRDAILSLSCFFKPAELPS